MQQLKAVILLSCAGITTLLAGCGGYLDAKVGGTLAGLAAGATITLQNNGADPLTLTADGAFTFHVPVSAGAEYKVTVATQPTNQTCSVTNGVGVANTGSVSSIGVACTTNGSVSGTIGIILTGLAKDTSVTLSNKGSDLLIAKADGSYVFQTALAIGEPYNVMIATQPSSKVCVVTGGFGVVPSSLTPTYVPVTCS